MSAPSPIFSPTPEVAARVAAALCDPFMSLADLADELKVSLPALSLYIMRDDTREQLRAVESAQAIHTRLAAGTSLAKATDALHRSLDDYIFEVGRLPWHPASAGPRALEQRRRSRETANRAASLLFRFSKFDPSRPRVARLSEPGRVSPPRKGEVPSLRAGGGRPPESQQLETPLETFLHNRVTPFLDPLDAPTPVTLLDRAATDLPFPKRRSREKGGEPREPSPVSTRHHTPSPAQNSELAAHHSTRTEDSGPRTEDRILSRPPFTPLTLNGTPLISTTPSPNSS